jgi:CheY-like chemotaxis protein
MVDAPTGDRARPRVLVVDDELPNLQTFQRVWRKHYDIELAESAELGLALLAGHAFDVVLTDYAMPGMDGAAFVRAAQGVQPVAFVMITGHQESPAVRELAASGTVFQVVGKPWDRSTICDVVSRAAEQTRGLRVAR